MHTSIASRPKTATALRTTGVNPDRVSEITRRAAGLSRAELRQLQAAIAGWLGEPIADTPEPQAEGTPTPRSPPAGWVESRTKKGKNGRVLGPYYSRRWWEPMVNGKRKKGSVYLGKNPDGPAPKK